MRNYRGLTKEGKRVYGWYFKSFTSGLSFIITDATNHPYRFTKTKDCFVEVIPETVGQSTGLKDKNGNDLDWWEDDIFRHYISDYVLTMIFEDGCFFFKAENILYKCYDVINCWPTIPKKIGNIHENPKLLKEGKQ